MLLDPNGVPSVELQKAITDFYNSVNIDADNANSTEQVRP